jgi:hypothetical protein
METASASARAVGSASAASPARCIGVGVVVAVVNGRHFAAVLGAMSSRVKFLACKNKGAMRFVVVFIAESIYILFASVRGSDGVVHRSCVGWCREVVRIHKGGFPGDFRYVSWGRITFYRYVSIFSRSIVVKYTFQVGLADGVS